MPSSQWIVNPCSGYERDLSSIEKKLYRKNKRGFAALEFLVRALHDQLSINPFAKRPTAKVECDEEHYKQGYHLEGCLLRKARFRLPEQRGGSALGRILFEVNSTNGTVLLLAFYTHQTHTDNFDPREMVSRLSQGRLEF